MKVLILVGVVYLMFQFVQESHRIHTTDEKDLEKLRKLNWVFAANLFNAGSFINKWSSSIISFIKIIKPANVSVSVFENGDS